MLAYPGLEFDEPERPTVLEEHETLYIWDTLLDLYHIYKTVREYTTETGELNPTILTEVLKEEKLRLLEALADIRIIHHSYLSVVNPGKDNG